MAAAFLFNVKRCYNNSDMNNNPHWHQLVIDNIDLAQNHAMRVYQRKGYTRPRILEELVASGYLGLCRAARRYHPKHNTTFHTYAFHYIRGAIHDFISSELQADFGMPSTTFYKRIKCKQPISKQADVKEAYRQKQISLYKKHEEETPLTLLEQADSQAHLWRVVKDTCDSRQEQIIKLYYQSNWTYEQIAEHYKLTRQRIHQIIQQAYSKLRLTIPV